MSKINLNLNQLISYNLFFGYHVSKRNFRLNYFFLGSKKNIDLFNLNLSFAYVSKFMLILSDFFFRKCKIWFLNSNFFLFSNIKVLSILKKTLSGVVFFNSKFTNGSFTNYKFVSRVKIKNFPHCVFFPNVINNYYIINECFKISIPSFVITDSCDNPAPFFLIPSNSKSLESVVFYYFLLSKCYLKSKFLVSSFFLTKLVTKIFKKKNKFKFIFNVKNFSKNFKLVYNLKKLFFYSFKLFYFNFPITKTRLFTFFIKKLSVLGSVNKSLKFNRKLFFSFINSVLVKALGLMFYGSKKSSFFRLFYFF